MHSTSTRSPAVKSAIQAPYVIIDDFLPLAVAETMRNCIEDHFGKPGRHQPQTHMIWNYWYVPEMYAYLRTLPEMVFGRELSDRFHETLTRWSVENLGLDQATWPYVSLYVAGCRQGQHNDASGGRFAFVYSLTKNDRRTTGGETVIWHEQDYFGAMLHRPLAGRGFYDLIEPKFNRLVVFDDRMPHGVQLVEGNMDPSEGRLVVHGHLFESGPLVSGPLTREAVQQVATTMVLDYSAELTDALILYHGFAVLRFDIRPDGSTSKPQLILNRVVRLTGEGPSVERVIEGLIERAADMRFPSAEEATSVTLPVAFGNRLSELR